MLTLAIRDQTLFINWHSVGLYNYGCLFCYVSIGYVIIGALIFRDPLLKDAGMEHLLLKDLLHSCRVKYVYLGII